MYSTQVIESAISRYEAKAKHKLVRIDAQKSIELAAHFNSLWVDSKWKRSLTKEETLIIRNERVMSALDFEYFAARFATIQQDGGGICKLTPWGSQRIALDKIAKIEEEMVDASLRGEPVDGIIIAWHKARQLGATALGRAMIMHREITQQHRRCMSASVDDDKIMEMYDRDKLIYDNLPCFLKPELKYDEKAQHVYFESMDSRILYQTSTQKSGLGVSRQFELGHLTECSTWPYPKIIELDFLPTVPQSLHTLVIFESTAYMIGDWWNDFTERVRQGFSRRIKYVFIPYYAERTKYRAQPPEGWQPSQVALLHAQKVHDTSAEFIGHTYMLPKETLYWWETTRAEYQKAGSLNLFLVNYCATPEESFQHATKSSFDPELIQTMRDRVRAGMPFVIRKEVSAA